MTINGTLIISKTPPLTAKEGVVWIDTSTQIPRIKYFSGGGYIPLNDIQELPTIPETPTWDSLKGKPEVIAAGATQAEARTAIGAGTGNSNLVIGTTASTAAAGNHNHAVTAHSESGLSAAINIQDLAQALSAKIKALEGVIDDEEVIATDLNELSARVSALEAAFRNMIISKMQIDSIDVLKDLNYQGRPLFIVSNVAPAVVPDGVPQFYINTATGDLYSAKASDAVSDWILK